MQGIELRVGKYKEFEPSQEVFACVLQYPNSNGSVEDYTAVSYTHLDVYKRQSQYQLNFIRVWHMHQYH